MRELRLPWIAALMVVVLVAVACGNDDSSSVSVIAPASEANVVGDFDPANFDDPTNVDNEWLPLRPGAIHVFEGTALEDDEIIERRIVTIVTDLTKMIAGVEAVVILERDFNDDTLVEAEFGFFAQDNDGNVWHLGEYTEIYEDDELVGGRIWVVGSPDGALAGIQMWAQPQVASESYIQGFAPEPFNWADSGQVRATGRDLCVEVGCYTNVLVTAEFDTEDPSGAVQLKFYASGVGNIGVGFESDDPEEEQLELVDLRDLDAAELAEARAFALRMEARGFMYGLLRAVEQR